MLQYHWSGTGEVTHSDPGTADLCCTPACSLQYSRPSVEAAGGSSVACILVQAGHPRPCTGHSRRLETAGTRMNCGWSLTEVERGRHCPVELLRIFRFLINLFFFSSQFDVRDVSHCSCHSCCCQ